MDGVGTSRQRRNPVLVRPNAVKRHLQQRQQEADLHDRKVIASTYFSIGAFLVLACLTVSLLILPLVLPPLPPPPSLLLWLPVCMLILLVVLAFMPTDVRNMASSYL
jgi:FtsH-binding integral membrane protein